MNESTNLTPADSEFFGWYALRVRTGGELKLETSLTSKVYEIFLPTYLEPRQYSDRIKHVHAPLFPGYLFSRLDIRDRLPLLKTPGVDGVVSIAGVPAPIPAAEIDSIRKIVESQASPVPWPYLHSGDLVRIEFGSLSGLTGALLKVKGTDRLIVSVHLLQRSVSITIDRSWVRPVDAFPSPGAYPKSASYRR